jgi:hypothetical protein
MESNAYELVIGKSVGPVRLGETRQSIIDTLGEPESTRVSQLSIRDYYHDKGIFIQYRPKDELCKNISVGYPAQLIYEGCDLLFFTWVEIVRWLAQLDPTAEEAGDGWQSDALGIGIGPKRNDDGTYQQYWTTDEEAEDEMQRRNDEMPSNEECLRELGLID